MIFNLLGSKLGFTYLYKEPYTEAAHSKQITMKMAKVKDKERILKAAREKQEVTYKGGPIRLAADFSMEML